MTPPHGRPLRDHDGRGPAAVHDARVQAIGDGATEVVLEEVAERLAGEAVLG